MLLKTALSLKEMYNKVTGKEEKRFPWLTHVGTPLAVFLGTYGLLRYGGGNPIKAINTLLKGETPEMFLAKATDLPLKEIDPKFFKMGGMELTKAPILNWSKISPFLRKIVSKLEHMPETSKKKLYGLLEGADAVYPYEAVTSGNKVTSKIPIIASGGKKELSNIKAPKIYGSGAGGLEDNKVLEAKMFMDLKKKGYTGDIFPHTTFFDKINTRTAAKNKLKTLLNKYDYFYLKPTGSYATGVGGKGFPSSHEISRYLQNKKISQYHKNIIEDFLKNPKNYIAQKHVDIDTAPFGLQREFRVHAYGGKTIPLGSIPRGGNLWEVLKAEKMRRWIQKEYLDKLPTKLKNKFKNVAQGIDVVMTPEGPKILETNLGTFASGFLSPSMDMSILNPGTSTILNNILYRKLTGRFTTPASVMGGLIPAAATTYAVSDNN